MKKILWLSDSPFTNTGYATISRNVLNGVSDEFEGHFMGHNYIGQPLPPGITFKDGTKLKFSLWGAGREGYCKDLIQSRIQSLKPEAFGVLLDTFMLYPWILDHNFAPARSFFYFPSDGGGGLPHDCDKILKHFNHAVAMSKFGQKQAKELHGIDAEYIPHGVDHRLFTPLSLEERRKLRAELTVLSINGTKVKGFLQDKFVVGIVSRNQGRKMLDRGVKAFAKFCKDKPDAVLYCHTDIFDAAAVFDLRMLINRLGIQNRVCFSDMRYYENFEYHDMNKVYNVMDVFFLPTSGEGFGVPIIEAMSAGIPCVVTDYTTTPELLIEDGVCGIPVKLSGTQDLSMASLLYEQRTSLQNVDLLLTNGTLTGSWSVERGIMCIDDAAKALTTLYTSPELRKYYGETGREKVLRQYSWDVVLPQWKAFLRRITA